MTNSRGDTDAAPYSNTTSFAPAPGMGGPHTQTILASSPLRKLLLYPKRRLLAQSAQEMILESSEGVRLHGLYSRPQECNNQLVILLHGWEGCADSSYMVATTNALLEWGCAVFRLHLRDHGPSHALNPELFNSTRIDEVVDAITQILARFKEFQSTLVGFSLGGNFALRVAAKLARADQFPDTLLAVCPVLNPVATMDALCSPKNWLYERYFQQKWRRSLETKLKFYPELGYQGIFAKLGGLRAMNQFFVPQFTNFDTEEEYLHAYAITGDCLSEIAGSCYMLLSADDPIIPLADLEDIASPRNLRIEVTKQGGHVGFIKNYRLNCWLEDKLLALVNNT